MTWVVIVVVVVAVLLALYLVLLYNGLVQKRNRVDNAWSQIDVQLKRRRDLIPNLVETVKGYAAHERGTFEEVTQARAAAAGATTPAEAVSSPNADCKLSDYSLTKGSLNLKGANLAGCYLAGANLSNANAVSANMAGTVLTNANLAGAKLNFATLTGAQLAGATLTGVSWTQATCPDGTNASANGGTCVGHLG